MNPHPFFSNRKVVFLLASFCCLLWGSAYPAIKNGYALFAIAPTDIPSKMVFAGYRFLFAGLLLLLMAAVTKRDLKLNAKSLREYATLKAIGYSNGYLARVVMAAALILAVIGFLPGAALCIWLYDVVAGATFLPLAMTFGRAAVVFGLIFGMCAAAGLLAMRKLRDASPADMF